MLQSVGLAEPALAALARAAYKLLGLQSYFTAGPKEIRAWTIPIALSSIMWKWVFDTQYSLINWALHAVGLVKPFDMPNYLGEPTLAIMSIIAVNVWRGFPFGAVILLAGMTAVPQEILDAANIDGAGPVTRFRKVIVPMIAPVLFIGSLYDLVFTLTDMTVVYLLTLGGPANSSVQTSLNTNTSQLFASIYF